MPSGEDKPRAEIKSLVKAMRLLKLFSSQHDVWAAEDMASFLGYHKSSVQRILSTLENEGFLARVAPRKSAFRLGPEVLFPWQRGRSEPGSAIRCPAGHGRAGGKSPGNLLSVCG